MKKFLNYFSIFLIICLIIVIGFWLYEYSLKTQPAKSALNGDNGNVSGWAVSPNIGWIGFNSAGCEDDSDCYCPPDETDPACTELSYPCDDSCAKFVDYGVNIADNGKLSGHAWSSNVGWISFDESETGVPPSNDPCDESCIAKATASGQLGKSDVPIGGWARALAYDDGWDGWIRFDHNQDNPVYIDINGEFRGWAWGNDTIGWISFNCADASDTYPFTCDSERKNICQANEDCPGELLDVIDTDSCRDIECQLKICVDQSGDICQANENCPGTIISARDSNNCCDTTCELKTCEEQGYESCWEGEYCSGNILPASDTNNCCDDACEEEEPEDEDEEDKEE